MRNTLTLVLILVVFSSISCGSRPASNAPAGQIAIAHDGGTAFIPATISFHGDEWTISEPANYVSTNGTYSTYQSNTYRNETLKLFLGSANFGLEWSVTLHRLEKNNLDRRIKVLELYRASEGDAYLVNYANNKRIDPRKEFYANGEVKVISNYWLDLIMHGEGRGFYPSGNLWWEGEHDKDFFEASEAVFYHEDGSINTDLDTDEKKEKEYLRWRECQSDDSCDSMVEFLRKVDESSKLD